MIDFLSKTEADADLPLIGQGKSAKRPRRAAAIFNLLDKIPVGRSNLHVLGALLLVAGAIIGLGEYVIFPQLSARQIADRVYPNLVAFKESVEEVNTYVSELFTMISGEELPGPQISFSLPELLRSLRDKVAGEGTKFGFYDFLSQAQNSLVLISASFSGSGGFGGESKVAGIKITPLESQVDGDLRTIMETARICGSATSVSRDQLTLLSAALPQRFPRPLSSVEGNVTSLVQESTDYLGEASKAAHYYEVITDVQIDLVPTTISLVNLVQDLYLTSDPSIYLGVINSLAATVGDLAQRVSDLGSELPFGMEQLHADNLEVFTLFTRLLDETETAVSEEDSARFDDAVMQFELGLEVLATRAKTYELSFWQKTPLLKDYSALLVLFNRSEEGLRKFR